MTDVQPRFDIGLTMAGAISAGAYTAGVLDFLIEALDAWERERSSGAPSHAVSLRAISGASAGGISAAILAAALRHDFPHVRRSSSKLGAANPLYDSWVNMIDMSWLLQSRDIAPGKPPLSLFDSTRLDEIARKAIDYGSHVPTIDRPYLADPLHLMLTVTNLRGVPFAENLLGSQNYAQAMAMHGDCMRFALQGLGSTAGLAPLKDEQVLSFPANGGSKWEKWQGLACAALASGAFPFGLAPRELARAASAYSDIPVVIPGQCDSEGHSMPAEIVSIGAAWNPANPKPRGEYHFLAVDGGVIDNEPLELARIALAGGNPLARNARSGASADRAVLMIDPFVGPEDPGPSQISEIGLLKSVPALFNALKNQARFRPQDIALAVDETIYSRFLIAPSSDRSRGQDSAPAIACGSLGGFGGFLAQAFREHDFFLGRRNCQAFLWKHFTLPIDNKLFALWRGNDELVKRYLRPPRSPGKPPELPIIPLMPTLHPGLHPSAEEALPAWPQNACDPEALRGAIASRTKAVAESLAASLADSWPERLAVRVALWRYGPRGVDAALNMIRKGLSKHKLA